MTLDEAITICKEVVAEQMELYRDACPTVCFVSPQCTEIAALHSQLAEWLEELKWRRKQPEVRHGEWIIKPHGSYGQMRAFCSACGKHSGIGGIESNQRKPFCPNCGADMREEGDENDDIL